MIVVINYFLLAIIFSLRCLSFLACGEANIKNSGRIVNGKATTPHKYPWMAAMFTPQAFICGGAIISDRNILTAGHCVF